MNPATVNPVIVLSAARAAARAEVIEASRRRSRRRARKVVSTRIVR